MTDASAFRATITCKDWDTWLTCQVPLGDLPPGVVIAVRDYRLAQDAEAGTTTEGAHGRPYFGLLWGSPGTEAANDPEARDAARFESTKADPGDPP